MHEHLPPDIVTAARTVIADWDLEPLTETILSVARPCLRFESLYKPTTHIAGTFAGGYPEMPEGLEWPSIEGKRIPFVAQLNLAAVPNLPNHLLPRRGFLYFFYWCTNEHAESPWQVLWADCDVSSLQPMIISESEILPDWRGVRVYEQIRTSAVTVGASLSDGCLANALRESDAQGELDDGGLLDFVMSFEDDIDLQRAGGELTHHFSWGKSMGWINLEMLLSDFKPTATGYDDGRDTWCNLLQVSSCGTMHWSDDGDLAFFVRERNLQACHFGEVQVKILSS